MEGMKRLVLIGLGLLASSAVVAAGIRSAAASDTLHEQSEQLLDPAGWKALEVENARGSIEVRASSDGRVHLLAAKTVHGRSRKQTTELAAQIEVTTERTEGRFIVKVHYPQRSDVRIDFADLFSGDVEFPRSTVRIEVAAPPVLAVELRSASGDLSTTDRSGPQTLESRSGDITVRNARGRIEATSKSGDVSVTDVVAARVTTTSGDVAANGVAGPLSARTASGDIEIKGASDSLRLAAASGDIQVDRAPRGLAAETMSGGIEAPAVTGWAELHTTSGDIRFELRGPLRGAEISSVSGELRARIAAGLGFNLEARTTSGTIDTEIPMTLRTAERHAVSGRVAGGGPRVTLQTTSGDIAVESGGK